MKVLLALPLAAAFSVRSRRRFEETIAPAIFVMIIAQYLSDSISIPFFGTGACFLMSAAAVLYCVIRVMRINADPDRAEIPARILSPGLTAFLFYGVLFMLTGHEKGFREPVISQTMLAAALYLPIFSPVKHLWGKGSQGREPVRFFFLLSAFSMILAGSYRVRGVGDMSDPLQGLYAWFILWMLLHADDRDHRRDRFVIWAVCGAFFLLSLSGETGIILAGLLAVTAPIAVPASAGSRNPDPGGERSRQNRSPGRAGMMTAFLISVLPAYLCSHVAMAPYGIPGVDPKMRRDILLIYCHALFDGSRVGYGALWPLSFAACMLLCAALVLLVTFRRVQSGSFIEADRRFCRLFAGAWICGVIYCVCLCPVCLTGLRDIMILPLSMSGSLAPVIVMLITLMLGHWVERTENAERWRFILLMIAGILALFFYGCAGGWDTITGGLIFSNAGEQRCGSL